jgi:hypothetical protein
MRLSITMHAICYKIKSDIDYRFTSLFYRHSVPLASLLSINDVPLPLNTTAR